ncbi:MAG: mevalonate kinase family protein [Flavobacteriaceae bacterium]
MPDFIVQKAPGRICLFGDHQDFLGLPVIAGTIDRHIHLKAQTNDSSALTIALPDLGTSRTISLREELSELQPRDYFRSGLRVLQKAGIHVDQGYRIEISGDIPLQAGLSSSSALVVVWLRFLLEATQQLDRTTPEQLAQWAYQTEVLEFDEPGGLMDQYTIALGGLVHLDTRSGKHLRLSSDLGSLIVVDSGIPKETLEILTRSKTYALEAIARVQKQDPSFAIEQATERDFKQWSSLMTPEILPYWEAGIYNHLITQKALKALQEPLLDLPHIGKLMAAHQKFLSQNIQNTPQPIQKQMTLAMKMGAWGAKIVGSGGGGCYVIIAPEKLHLELISAISDFGVKEIFTTTITPSHA